MGGLAAEASASATADSDAQSVTVRERAQRFVETPLAALAANYPAKSSASHAVQRAERCRPFVDGISMPTFCCQKKKGYFHISVGPSSTTY